MATPRRVLMFGRDVMLLDTRRMVLQSAGYEVSTGTQLSELDRAVSLRSFDLLILCHTLALDECGRALALSLCRWPFMRTLRLRPGMVSCSTGLLDQVCKILDRSTDLAPHRSELVGAGPSLFSIHMHA